VSVFEIKTTSEDTVLYNKYGVFSKNELSQQLVDIVLTERGLADIYDLKTFQMRLVLRSLGIGYRCPLNETRVYDSTISPSMHQMLVGTLLGDSYMRHPKEFGVGHSINQMDYLYHIAEQLGDFVSTVEYKELAFGTAVDFWTHRHSILVPYFDRFYSHGKEKKYITDRSAHDLEPEGLAYWFMDDGKFGEYGMYLCVGNISDEEGAMLVRLLCSKFGIMSTFQAHDAAQGYHNIYIKARSRSHFIELIEPHVIPSMRYKLTGEKYPRLCQKNDIAERHISYCAKVGRTVRFSGDKEVENSIKSHSCVISKKELRVQQIKERIRNRCLVSHKAMREDLSEEELRKLLHAGYGDKEVAEKFGFGRTRVKRLREVFGIPTKYKRMRNQVEK